MSRRTKLLITALFLVLLGIPVVYGYLTWSPPNPLRFTIVDNHGPRVISELGETMVLVDVLVENTSGVPVYLISGILADAGGDVATWGGIFPFSMGIDSWVPPHGVWHGQFYLTPKAYSQLGDARWETQYHSISRTKATGTKAQSGMWATTDY